MQHRHTIPVVDRSRSGSTVSKPFSGRLRGHGRTIVQLIIAACLVSAGLWHVNRFQTIFARLSSHTSPSTCSSRLKNAGLNFESDGLRSSGNKHTITRHSLYNSMAQGLLAKGLSIGGIITQGLSQDDLFHFPGGQTGNNPKQVQAVLRPLDVPVRAVIAPIRDVKVASRLHDATIKHVVPAVPEAVVWLQNQSIFHSTVYHASTHMQPVYVDESGKDLEGEAVVRVAKAMCPIKAVLERVVATSSGVVIACWQVLPSGSEPAELREALKDILPAAPPPGAQVVRQPAILHTTLARLLKLPSRSQFQSAFVSQRLQKSVEAMSQELCGLEVELGELLLVEEFDLLALALNGRYKVHMVAPFQCPA